MDWCLGTNFDTALYKATHPLQESLIVQTHAYLIFSRHLLQNRETEPLRDAAICAVILLVFNYLYNFFDYMKTVMWEIVNTLLGGGDDWDERTGSMF